MAFCVGPMLASEADVASLDNRRDPNVMVMLLARQYRNERNFWLSLFTLAAWTVLWVVYTVRQADPAWRFRPCCGGGRRSGGGGGAERGRF